MPTQPGQGTIHGIGDGEFKRLSPEEVDYMLDDDSSLLSTHINLIPLQNTVSSQRHFYGNRFFTQADPLVEPEAPIVRNTDKQGKSFDYLYGEKAGAVRADSPGRVVSVSDGLVEYETDGGEKRSVPLHRNFPMNRKNRFHQTPVVKEGDRVEKGGLLARSNYTDESGALALGRNARVALVPYLGYTLDDATVISESFADKLRSDHMYSYNAVPDPSVKRDKNHYMSVFPETFSKKQLDKLDESGVAKPGTYLEKGDPVYLETQPQTVRSEDRLKGAMGKYLRHRRRDKSQVWEHEEPGYVSDVVPRKDGGYSLNVSVSKPAKEGDKLVDRSGGKNTVARVIPDSRMPRDEKGVKYDMLANPLGLPSRQNVNFLYSALLGKVAEKRGESFETPAYNKPGEKWYDTVKKLLDENGLKSVEPVYDPVAEKYLEQPVTTGNNYIMKLQHQGAGKLSARGQGGYSSWEAPRKGGDEMGQSKRMSGLESASALSAGAYGVLKDTATLRGQKNEDYWRNVRQGRVPAKPGHPFAWDKMKAFLHGAGLAARGSANGKQRLGPLTDADLDKWKAEEIENADMVDLKTGKGIKGGLFDESRAHRNAWGKISLDYPVPNPAMEDQLLKLLDIKKKDLPGILAGDKPADPSDPSSAGPLGLYRKLKNLDPEKERERNLAIIRGGAKTKRPRAIDALNTLEGLKRNNLEPKDLMITQIPVIPSRYRPFQMMGDVFMPGDVNELYQDVFRSRETDRELRGEFGEEGAGDQRKRVYNAVKALYGTGDTENRKLAEKQVSGFMKQLLGSSPKYSVFQRHLFSKPVDFSGRGVAGIDPNLGMDELGVPEKMGWKLYAPYIQRRLVKQGLTPAQALRETNDRTSRAKKALDAESRERPVMYTRSPAWHKSNLLGAYPRFHEGNNVRVNPLVAPGMTLDFDGDSNIGHVVVKGRKDVLDSRIIGKGLAKSHGREMVESMFQNIDIPEIGRDEEIAVVDLGDFPREEYNNTKPDGKNGPIHYYTVPAGTKVVAFDAHDYAPVWADVDYFSVHPDREVEIVNLSGGYQIITDDDPRAVYGIDPSTPGFGLERFTPARAMEKNVCVARANTFHPAVPEEGFIDEVEFADRKFGLDPDFGYFLGAMAGGGWTDAGDENASGPGNRTLPRFAALGPGKFIRGVLAGLLDTIGCVTNSGDGKHEGLSVTVTSGSLRLVRDAGFLFDLAGIKSAVSSGRSTRGGDKSWVLTCSSVDFYERGGEIVKFMAVPRKVRAYREARRPPGLSDCQRTLMLPMTRSLIDRLYKTCPNPEITPETRETGGEKFETEKAFRAVKSAFYKIRESKADCRVSPGKITSFLELVIGHPGYFDKGKLDGLLGDDEWRQFLKLYDREDMCWLAVENVEYTGNPETGYDLTVPGYETFMNSDGVILSNTLNVHTPALREAVDDVKNRLMPSKQIFSIRDPEKLINTPEQDHIWALYRAAHQPSGKNHRFQTKSDALRAIKQGEIPLSDEVDWLED